MEEVKQENEGKEIEFKTVVWTEEDTKKEYEKQNPYKKWNFDFKINIPEGVNAIDEDCFNKFEYFCNLLVYSFLLPIRILL